MSRIQRLRNILLGKGSSIAYAAISLILAIVPEGCFKVLRISAKWSDETTVLINRILTCIIVFILFRAGYAIYLKCRKKVLLRCDGISIQIEYGDITEIRNGVKVIHFDECYTTTIGDRPADIKAESVCGQFLIKNEAVIERIPRLIEESKVTSLRGGSKYNNQTRYEPGTVLQYRDYLLLAFAKLDENGRGHLTYEEYLKCLNLLWEKINTFHGTNDVYVPILGSYITVFDKELTQQQLLDIMIQSYFLSPHRLKNPHKLHIVCKEREGFSINDAFGVD